MLLIMSLFQELDEIKMSTAQKHPGKIRERKKKQTAERK